MGLEVNAFIWYSMYMKFWTPEEEQIIKDNQSKSAKELAYILNRSVNSVKTKKERLGLVRTHLYPVAIGDIFGRLTVLEISSKTDKKGHKRRVATCQCECGKQNSVPCSRLRSGTTQSCGCYGKEMALLAISRDAGEATLNFWEGSYKKAARNRGFSWNLSKEQFRDLISKNCFWCDNQPKPWNIYIKRDGTRSRKIANEKYIEQAWVNINGVDRINSGIGYEPNNVVPCCSECNIAKSDRSAKDFFEHCKRVTDFVTKKINK